MNAIVSENLSKNYRAFKAVDNVNLNIKQGEIYGFLGLNGAGKTTTMRMLLNMTKPSAGKAYIFGQEVSHVKAGFWNKVGYLIETPKSYLNLTVLENLKLYAKMRLLDPVQSIKRINYLMSEFMLDPYRNKKVRDLSLGNNQKLGIIKAVIHEPRILILDEPTNGLDPKGINVVRNYFKRISKENGVTILISSHLIAEMEKMFTSFGIIDNGIILEQLSRTTYMKQAKKYIVADFNSQSELYKAVNILQEQGFSNCFFIKAKQLFVVQPKKNKIILSLLINKHIIPISWYIKTEMLEDYFLKRINANAEKDRHE
ncbi:hypothetical protein X350_08790 [Oenococcus oeni S12]|uniref:ABC transporter ATP-binding protein n=1 Tax=Oenococcus oeni TaxID=1247 RepID=UPI00050E4473|nr:ABC transporter ATP-binding protein [Oenococcus oeni]KGH87478.1 hypothetical protein X350_08790 [Oenococcus oeni S12]